MFVHGEVKSPAPVQGLAHKLKIPLPVVILPMSEHCAVHVPQVLLENGDHVRVGDTLPWILTW